MRDYSHVVIGGGVIGLAVAARLSRTAAHRVLLIERNRALGQETSARNSEVIHAGIHHPADSLRTKLCIQGKHMLYELGSKHGLALKQCGKWTVAQTESQEEYLNDMVARAKVTGVPLEFVSLERAKQLEPSVIAKQAILNSPTSGIVSAHGLMDLLEAQVQANGGDIVLDTTVQNVTKASEGYIINCLSGQETIDISSDCVINSAGHGAVDISNSLLPADRHLRAYYGKGTYFSYSGSSRVSRLVYPCPSDFGSLGTHLTIDLGGQIRFGPDFSWTDSPDDLKADPKNLAEAASEIKQYFRGVDESHLVADYVGIRPKIVSHKKFTDFVIRSENGFPGFVNLLNMESPGLTSSLAIAVMVEDLL